MSLFFLFLGAGDKVGYDVLEADVAARQEADEADKEEEAVLPQPGDGKERKRNLTRERGKPDKADTDHRGRAARAGKLQLGSPIFL